MNKQQTNHEQVLKQIISQIQQMLRQELEHLRAPFKIPSINIKMGEFQTPYHQSEGMQWSNK